MPLMVATAVFILTPLSSSADFPNALNRAPPVTAELTFYGMLQVRTINVGATYLRQTSPPPFFVKFYTPEVY